MSMRFPLSLRAARACALATLILSFGLSPSFARMGGSAGGSFAHSSFGMGHASHFAPHGFNRRFEPGRFGFNRFGGNQLLVGGGWGWDGWGGVPGSTGASQPILVDEGAPVIINIGVDPGPGAAAALSGGCVIHKLNYDNTGKYVGERQIPQC
jgi:hypothetical protein